MRAQRLNPCLCNTDAVKWIKNKSLGRKQPFLTAAQRKSYCTFISGLKMKKKWGLGISKSEMRQPKQTLNSNRQNWWERRESRTPGRAKISRWQIIWPSRRDNIVNLELNYFGEPKAIYHPAWLFSTAVFRARPEKGNNETSENYSGSIIRARAFQCVSDPRLIRRNLRLDGRRPRKFANRKSMIIPRSTCIFARGVNLQCFCKSVRFVVRGDGDA